MEVLPPILKYCFGDCYSSEGLVDACSVHVRFFTELTYVGKRGLPALPYSLLYEFLLLCKPELCWSVGRTKG